MPTASWSAALPCDPHAAPGAATPIGLLAAGGRTTACAFHKAAHEYRIVKIGGASRDRFIPWKKTLFRIAKQKSQVLDFSFEKHVLYKT